MTITLKKLRQGLGISEREVVEQVHKMYDVRISERTLRHFEGKSASSGQVVPGTKLKSQDIRQAIETAKRESTQGTAPQPQSNVEDSSVLSILERKGVTRNDFTTYWQDQDFTIDDLKTLTGVGEDVIKRAAEALNLEPREQQRKLLERPPYDPQKITRSKWENWENLSAAQRANTAYIRAGEMRTNAMLKVASDLGLNRQTLNAYYDAYSLKRLTEGFGLGSINDLYVLLGVMNVPLKEKAKPSGDVDHLPLPIRFPARNGTRHDEQVPVAASPEAPTKPQLSGTGSNPLQQLQAEHDALYATAGRDLDRINEIDEELKRLTEEREELAERVGPTRDRLERYNRAIEALGEIYK